MVTTSARGRVRSRLEYAAYRVGGAAALRLPPRAAQRLARGVARAAQPALAGRRATVERHMRRVYGDALTESELSAAVRAVFDSYARYWLEAFRLPRETPESIRAGAYMVGREHLEKAFAEGRGVIMAIPHLGGWDFGGAWMAAEGFKPLAVAEILEPPQLFEWFTAWRRRLGVEVVPADASAGTALLEALREGRTVGLVSDRDILGSGVEVEFFGETTTLPAGPATLALRTGAPLLPAAIYFEGVDGHRAVVRPPLDLSRTGRFREDVHRVTQAVAHELEELIRVAPQQWHLLQPNWPSDPGWRHGG